MTGPASRRGEFCTIADEVGRLCRRPEFVSCRPMTPSWLRTRPATIDAAPDRRLLYTTAISPKASAAPPLLYVLDGFVVGCTLGCDLALPPFPKFGFRSLHAATTSGSICGKALVACFRCGVSVIIGRMQSNMMPSPLLAPLRTKPAWLHAALILAQGCQVTG